MVNHNTTEIADIVFTINQDRLHLLGITKGDTPLWGIHNILPVSIVEIINPDGPLRVFLPIAP